jgi:hypothetical protein
MDRSSLTSRSSRTRSQHDRDARPLKQDDVAFMFPADHAIYQTNTMSQSHTGMDLPQSTCFQWNYTARNHDGTVKTTGRPGNPRFYGQTIIVVRSVCSPAAGGQSSLKQTVPRRGNGRHWKSQLFTRNITHHTCLAPLTHTARCSSLYRQAANLAFRGSRPASRPST